MAIFDDNDDSVGGNYVLLLNIWKYAKEWSYEQFHFEYSNLKGNKNNIKSDFFSFFYSKLFHIVFNEPCKNNRWNIQNYYESKTQFTRDEIIAPTHLLFFLIIHIVFWSIIRSQPEIIHILKHYK